MPTFEPLAPPVSDGPTFGEPALKPPMSLESLLMRFRLITPEQLDQALREKTETGKDVGAIVVERGWVNEDQLSRLVSYAPAFSAEPEDAVEVQPEHTFEMQPEQTFEAQAEPAVEVEAEPESQPQPEAQNLSEPEPAADVPHAFELATTSLMLPPALDLIEEPEAVAAELTDSHEPVAEAERLSEITPVDEPAEEQQPEPEAQAVSEPEPVQAEAAPEPVVETTEPVVETPELVVEPVEVAAEAEPQVVRFVEPAPIETIARVFVRLSNGERVEAGSFDDIATARARAEEVVRQVSDDGDNGWPFFGGRFIRPEAIVSVDVDATVVRYA